MLNFLKNDFEQISPLRTWDEIKLFITKSLNKGQIPTWDNYLQEQMLDPHEENLADYKRRFLDLAQNDFLKEIILTPSFEIYFHSANNVQVFEKNFTKKNICIPIDEEDWQLWLDLIAVRFQQNWNFENPFVSFYADIFGRKFRISLIHQSTSPLSHSKMMMRPIQSTPYSLENFGSEIILEELVRKKSNILIAGSTGSGKTSLLSSMLNLIEEEEHLIVLEDTYEIQTQHKNQTRFLAGETPKTSLKYYLSCALRLTPDRLVLGEMRSDETLPFVMAMNSGVRGLFSTIHGHSAAQALERLCLLFSIYSGELGINYEAIMKLVSKNLDYIIYVEDKKVKEVIKVMGSEGGTPFFEHLLHD